MGCHQSETGIFERKANLKPFQNMRTVRLLQKKNGIPFQSVYQDAIREL